MAVISQKLWDILGKAIQDPAFRNKLLANPDATIKAEGGDIGKAKVAMNWIDGTNSLNISVANAGADWNGSILLSLKK